MGRTSDHRFRGELVTVPSSIRDFCNHSVVRPYANYRTGIARVNFPEKKLYPGCARRQVAAMQVAVMQVARRLA